MKNVFRREWSVPKGTTVESAGVTHAVTALTMGRGTWIYPQRENPVFFVTDKGLLFTGATVVREKKPFGSVKTVGHFDPKEGRTRVGQVMRDIVKDPNQLYSEGTNSGLNVPGANGRSKER
jgi:hypothetical protein